jgi:mobilization protein NikA
LTTGDNRVDDERRSVTMTTKISRKNVKLLKEHVVNVRCTEQQRELLESVASREGLGLSTWLLHVGLRVAAERQAAAGQAR